MEEFGPHITLDLKGCPKEILSDYSLHFDYLKTLPELIHMTPITQPYVFPYSGLVPEDKGITGIVIMLEPVIVFTVTTVLLNNGFALAHSDAPFINFDIILLSKLTSTGQNNL